MKESWKILKLGVYIFALPLVATAAASAHQWMTTNTVLSVVPPMPAAASSAPVARINAVRNHTITINADGEVQGRVASINHKSRVPLGLSNVTVYFSRDGRIAKKGYTNDDGTFVVKGLKEGVYSFVAAGELSFATCGVNVVKGSGDVENYIEVASISPNFEMAREIIESELPETIKRDIKQNFDAGKTSVADVAGSNRVELDGDVLKGQVVSLVHEKLTSGLKAHLFKANEKVSDFEINTDGTFEVSGLKAGVYDIVVVGNDGVAAVSFEAVAPIDEDSSEAYTSLQETLFTNFVVALAPQFDGAIGGSDAVVYDASPGQFVGDNLGGGIACGSSCGSCGDYSGFSSGCGGGCSRFGGFRGRLLLPLIAAGIAIPLAVGGSSPSSPN